jgi:uncharacterized membrane protein
VSGDRAGAAARRSVAGMWRPVLSNLWWMGWNLTLAMLPASLALMLFRRSARPSAGWWLGFAAFVAFLPNAAYVLTDVIHLPPDLAAAQTTRVELVLIAQFGLLFLGGFGAYALSVLRLERWLSDRGWSPVRVGLVDVSIHVLAAVGVLLGRVFRFNSWHLVNRPGDIVEVVGRGVTDPQVTTLVLVVLAAMLFATGTMLTRAVAVGGRRLII